MEAIIKPSVTEITEANHIVCLRQRFNQRREQKPYVTSIKEDFDREKLFATKWKINWALSWEEYKAIAAKPCNVCNSFQIGYNHCTVNRDVRGTAEYRVSNCLPFCLDCSKMRNPFKSTAKFKAHLKKILLTMKD